MMKYTHDMASFTATLDKVLLLATLVGSDLQRFERESGLTTARTHLLWILGTAGPATQQSLASALNVSARNVTGLVDGLVASGHVSREPHPTDRRAVLVTPTERGRAAIRSLIEDHELLARRLFEHVAAGELAVFAATLDQTIETFTRLMEQQA
jgi:DNA-binding MarR family transcriptional regulator